MLEPYMRVLRLSNILDTSQLLTHSAVIAAGDCISYLNHNV